MLYPNDIAVALKEWDCVCQALITGRQVVMLRKGGIHESGGEFEVEFRRFLLFPTFLHQDKAMIKESAHDLFKFAGCEPVKIQLAAFADITDIVRIESDAQIQKIADLHIWTDHFIDMRLNYRPENPLFLLLARVNALPNPITIDNRPQYGGCKSWIGLKRTLDVSLGKPVLDAPSYQHVRDEIMLRVQ